MIRYEYLENGAFFKRRDRIFRKVDGLRVRTLKNELFTIRDPGVMVTPVSEKEALVERRRLIERRKKIDEILSNKK